MIKMRGILTISIAVLTMIAASPPLCAQPSASPQSPDPALTAENNSKAADSTFVQSRQLLQQGKYDAALAALHDIEAQHPATKGLAHELGVAYYKKGDYVNAVASLKKARDENPDDGEAGPQGNTINQEAGRLHHRRDFRRLPFSAKQRRSRNRPSCNRPRRVRGPGPW